MVSMHTYCGYGSAMERSRMRVEIQHPNWTRIGEESQESY